jgi:hypothetical protein
MDQPPPAPLGYNNPYGPPPPQWGPPPAKPWRFILQVLAGLALGSVASAVVWALGWEQFMGSGSSGGALLAVPGIKFAAAIVCFCLPGWRGLGLGLLLSIGIGALIFFVTCAAHFDAPK